MTHPLSSKSLSSKTAEDANCFAFEVSGDFFGDHHVIIEITNVEPAEPEVGICGPTIEIEAFTMDGRACKLTMLEHERAIEEAISYMERQAEISENELMDR